MQQTEEKVMRPLGKLFFSRIALAIFFIALGFPIGAWLWPAIQVGLSSERVLKGTELRLLSVKGPFQIYGAKGRTGAPDSFAIFMNSKCLVLQESDTDDARVEITQFEGGLEVLHTVKDSKSRTIERSISFYDGNGVATTTYLDNDGDGRWDCLLDHASKRKFFREGDCWVERKGAGASH